MMKKGNINNKEIFILLKKTGVTDSRFLVDVDNRDNLLRSTIKSTHGRAAMGSNME
jgi:hypothetical protein